MSKQVRVRTRRPPAQLDEQDAMLESVRNIINMPLAEYRRRTTNPAASLMVQCPLYYAELADVKRTKVLRD